MARRALSVCPVAGCPELTPGGRCKAHARTSAGGARYRDTHKADPSTIRRWRRTRLAYLVAHPLCESERCSVVAMPLRPAATEVDHVDGLGLQGPRAFDVANYQALCHSCHSRKTAQESFGR
jgi:5-methylcytosine-specific restriction protein A